MLSLAYKSIQNSKFEFNRINFMLLVLILQLIELITKLKVSILPVLFDTLILKRAIESKYLKH